MTNEFIKKAEMVLSERSHTKVTFRVVGKNNGVSRQGFEFKSETSNAAPVIYFDVQDDPEDFEEFIVDVMNKYSGIPEPSVDTGMFENRDSILKLVRRFLCSKEMNQSFLSSVCHRDFEDLAVYYRMVIRDDGNGFMSSVITNEYAAKFNLTIEDLEQAAIENQKPNDFVTFSMYDILMDIKPNMSESFAPDSFPMYVVTTKNRLHGASALLASIVFKGIAAMVEDDLFILPSSVHELIVIPVCSGDVKSLRGMVTAINATELQEEEILSNSVYKYTRKTGEVTLA